MSADLRRYLYAEHLIACADTVTLLTVEEVTDIRKRALAGEFDSDIWPERSK